jgi:predicted GNAT family acetyltransferase
MTIKQTDNNERGMFFIPDGTRILGRMTYVWAGKDRIIIDHTEVGPELKGKGAGKQLLSQAVEFAREKHIKIVPLCPFARSVFQKVPEFRDVI